MSPANSNTVMQKQQRLGDNIGIEKVYHSMDCAAIGAKFMEVTTASANAPSELPKLIQKVLAEFVATFFLVFAGCGAILVDITHGGNIAHVAIAASFGLAVMIMVYSIGHISGAHLNPAVTIAFASVQRFPLIEVPAYLMAQVGGSLLASVLLRLILHDSMLIAQAVNQPSDGNLQSFVVEVVITFVLMFVIAGVASDSRAVGEMAGLAIGSTIALNGVYAGPLSGASMNPARSIGPAIVAKKFTSLYVYIAGPILGAIIGAWTYNTVRLPEPADKKTSPKKSFLIPCFISQEP
ncbi:hypothetical protein L7F22_024822 [Adiantum nelumboides]|nr:hypothetical protein [Adiantum nelumboides]